MSDILAKIAEIRKDVVALTAKLDALLDEAKPKGPRIYTQSDVVHDFADIERILRRFSFGKIVVDIATQDRYKIMHVEYSTAEGIYVVKCEKLYAPGNKTFRIDEVVAIGY